LVKIEQFRKEYFITQLCTSTSGTSYFGLERAAQSKEEADYHGLKLTP